MIFLCVYLKLSKNYICLIYNRKMSVQFSYITSDPLQPDDCKLSVLLTFHINNKPIWRLAILASTDASIDYAALKI